MRPGQRLEILTQIKYNLLIVPIRYRHAFILMIQGALHNHDIDSRRPAAVPWLPFGSFGARAAERAVHHRFARFGFRRAGTSLLQIFTNPKGRASQAYTSIELSKRRGAA